MPVTTLKKRKEFLAIARSGTKVVCSGFILQALPCNRPDDTSTIRVGYTVTRKVGCAVVRNRVKRRLRVLVHDILLHHAPSGYDYVLIGRHSTKTRSFSSLEGDMRYCLRKLNAQISEEQRSAHGHV